MTADSLTVRIRGVVNAEARSSSAPFAETITIGTSAPRNCSSCGVEECFRHMPQRIDEIAFGRTACLVDEYWPEFDRYLCEIEQPHDLLLVPLDGRRFRKAGYAWSTGSFEHFRQSWRVTLHRAYRSRKLAMQGAARQKALLAFNERLARSYASLLPYDVTHLIVMQNLLPWLWRDGHLGGRTFDVLMTALPLSELHERLDRASAMHPESRTLADFRADESLVRMESEALKGARRIITPHSGIARLYEGRAILIDWIVPIQASPAKAVDPCRPRIVLPASTVGRKGAYELRSALRGLDIDLTIVGAQHEGDDFWQGLSVERRRDADDWMDGATAMVLPAHVEHRPRRLLEAVARGIPVIASSACGLEHITGVITVPPGDVEALRREIKSVVFAPRGA